MVHTRIRSYVAKKCFTPGAVSNFEVKEYENDIYKPVCRYETINEYFATSNNKEIQKFCFNTSTT